MPAGTSSRLAVPPLVTAPSRWDELHADGLHLFLEVEVGLVGHAVRLQRVAEGAQALEAHGLALAHVVGHHARQLAQHGHHVGVGHGAHLAQPAGQLLGGDGRFSL